MAATDNDDFAVLTGPWGADLRPSLFMVKKRNTGSGMTEVHMLSAESGHQHYALQVPTGLHVTDGSWKFRLADWDGDGLPDLWAIKTRGSGSGKTEVHILSGASNFSQFVLQTSTALEQFDGELFDFDIIKPYSAPRPNLVAFKRAATGTNSTEIHILSGASSFQQFTHQSGTALHETGTDDNWLFRMTDWDKDGYYDMLIISNVNGGEFHVLKGHQFQNFSLHTQVNQGNAKDIFGVPDEQWSMIQSCGTAALGVIGFWVAGPLSFPVTATLFMGTYVQAIDCYRNIVKYNRTQGAPQQGGGGGGGGGGHHHDHDHGGGGGGGEGGGDDGGPPDGHIDMTITPGAMLIHPRP